MPTAQEILDSIMGINGFTVEVTDVLFQTTTKTATIGIRPVDTHQAICDGCGRTVDRIKDRRIQFFRDKPVFDWAVRLKLKRRRVVCPRCGVRTERLPFVDGRSRFTRRFERLVFDDGMETTVAAAAAKHGITWHQAARIEYALLEQYNTHRGPLRKVRWMGADEICYGRRNNLYTIITDIEAGSVIGVAEGHQTGSLDAFFKAAGKEFCDCVEVACIDMWKAFANSIRSFCVNAKIIFDKFHIVRHLNDAVDEVRRQLFFRRGGRRRKAFTGKRWLLLRRWFNLTRSQKGLLKGMLALNKRLNVAYYLKEIFGSLWSYTSRAWAIKFLDRWEQQLRWQRLEPLRKFAVMVRKHLDGILNYCDVKIPLGKVEAINGVVKGIIRRSRGFRNHRHGALKIMFCTDPTARAVLDQFHS